MSDLIPDEEREARAEAARIWQISPGIDPTDKVDAMRSHSAFVRGWLARGRRVSPVTREALTNLRDVYERASDVRPVNDDDMFAAVQEFLNRVCDADGNLLSVSPPAEVTDEMVERAARALGEFVTHGGVDDLSGPNGEYWIREARVVLSAALGGGDQ